MVILPSIATTVAVIVVLAGMTSAIPDYRNFFPYNYKRGFAPVYHQPWKAQRSQSVTYRPWNKPALHYTPAVRKNDTSGTRKTTVGLTNAKYQPYHHNLIQRNYYGAPKQCYQCARSPEYSMYNMRKQKKNVEYPYAPKHLRKGKVYVTSFVKTGEKVGGWGACYGPIDEAKAAQLGVTRSTCTGNCFVRIDDNKNVFRSCYRGEHGVNPHLLGCHRQAGSTYCFCAGNLCNGHTPPGHTKKH